MDGKRRQVRQVTRWKDEIGSFAGVIWNIQTTDNDEWRRLGEAFVLQWTQKAADDDVYVSPYAVVCSNS